MDRKLISEISRTEVFYTASLHFACEESKNLRAISDVFRKALKIEDDVTVVDRGFEVCLFRDFAKAGLLNRQDNRFEKQTFDNVFILSDDSIVLVEAKVHQGFNNQQIGQMKEARTILESQDTPWSKVYLVGLCSSKYSPKQDTQDQFNAVIRWSELSSALNSHEALFTQADSIYQN